MMCVILPSSTRGSVAVPKKSVDLDKFHIPYSWEKSVSLPVMSPHGLSMSSLCAFHRPISELGQS